MGSTTLPSVLVVPVQDVGAWLVGVEVAEPDGAPGEVIDEAAVVEVHGHEPALGHHAMGIQNGAVGREHVVEGKPAEPRDR